MVLLCTGPLSFFQLLVLLCVVTGEHSGNSQDTAQILSFTFEKWIPSKHQWESTTDIQKEDHIRLMCVVDDDLISGAFNIRKWNEDTAVKNVTYPSQRQVVYEIPSLECDNSGSYVCEGGNGMNRSLSLDILECAPRILSFAFEKWDPLEKQWTATTDIERGKDIRLICTVAGSSSDQFSLRKTDAKTALGPLERPNDQQIIHEFRDLQCEQAGEYVCEDKSGVSRLLDIAVSGCSSDILSFTFEELDKNQQDWKTTTEIERGRDIRLTCIISGPFAEKFTIKKLGDTSDLSSLEYPINRQITCELKNVGCESLGAYICDDGAGTSRTTELGIFGCQPSFCSNALLSGETAFVKLGEAKTFNLCVIAFPDISVTVTSLAEDGSQINLSHVMPDSKVWDIQYEPNPDTFGAFKISVSKTISSRSDFGKNVVSISTTHKGQQETLEYMIELLQSGDSVQCPSDLKIDDLAPESLKLSWTSKKETEFSQEFAVFMKQDKGDWVPYDGTTQKTWLLITGLHEETQYAFRVIPVNAGMEKPNGDECMNTLTVNTTKYDVSTTNGARSIVFDAVLIVICSLSGVSIVLTAVLCFFMHRRRQQSQMIYNIPSYQEDCEAGSTLLIV